MLVLSRKESDKIVFPTVGITIEVVRIRGNSARLGIDAPPEVPILRHEIADLKCVEFISEGDAKQQLHRLAGAVRQRLDDTAEALNWLHQHLDATRDAIGQELILKVFGNLKAMEREADEALEDSKSSLAQALLVEADPHDCKLLAGYLRWCGIETSTVENGQAALDFLELHALPDVVLVDMPCLLSPGQCLLKTVRADARLRTVRLFAIGHAEPQTLGVEIGPGGFDRWFSKPVDPEALVREITRVGGVASTAV